MDPLALAAKIVVAVVLIIGGLGWTLICYEDGAMGGSHPMRGMLTGLAVAAGGVLLLIY